MPRTRVTGPLLRTPLASINAVINGDFRVWQRGSSFTSPNNVYTADGWKALFGGTMTYNVGVSGIGFLFGGLIPGSLVMTCTVADTSIAAGEYGGLVHYIEGYNAVPLMQRPIVLSFYCYSNKAGTYGVALRNGGFDRSYVAEFTVAANVWERKVILIPASPAAGTWYTDNRLGMSISFMLVVGSNFQAMPNVWQTGNFFGTAGMINHSDVAGNAFYLACVDLRPGVEAPLPFEPRPYGEELDLCRRYFFKTYKETDPPGTVTYNGVLTMPVTGNGPNYVWGNLDFPVNMRVAPAVTLYNPAAAGNAQAHNAFTNNPCSGTTMQHATERHVGLFATSDTTATLAHYCALHLTASAEF